MSTGIPELNSSDVCLVLLIRPLMAHNLGPPRLLDDGAPIFTIGEYVLVRIPDIRVEGHDDEGTVVGTDLPPTSNGSSPQHFAFVRDVRLQPGNAFMLEVYPVLSFCRTGGAVSTYNRLAKTTKAALLPLPPLSPLHPTPEAFGAPLDLGNWSNTRDSFLHVIPRRFIMPGKRPFKRMDPPLIMPVSELFRIDQYRGYLRSCTQTTDTNGQSHPLPNGGSGDERGSSNPRHGKTGDWGGQGDSLVTSVTSSPTIISDGGGGHKAAGAELWELSIEPTHDLLVLEGVDSDAEDADATFRDELVMLARDDPIWREELGKYLREEEKERKMMEKERLTRLGHWREDVAIQAN